MSSSDLFGAPILRNGFGFALRRAAVAAAARARGARLVPAARGLVAATLASLSIGTASAAEITYLSVTGIWHDPVDTEPGSQPGDPAITNGVPTSSISWGTTSGEQSGYDFTASIPPPFTLPGPIPF